MKGPKKYHAKKNIQVIYLIPPRSAFLSHQLALLVTLYIWSCALKDKTLHSKNKLMRRLILVKGPKKYHAKKIIPSYLINYTSKCLSLAPISIIGFSF